MEISIVQHNIYNQSMGTLQQDEKKLPSLKSEGMNHQELNDGDVIIKKKEGTYLSIGEEKLFEMLERAAKALVIPRVELQFSIHEKTKEISVKIIDMESREVIREIPSKEVLDMAAKMNELAGLFVDKKI